MSSHAKKRSSTGHHVLLPASNSRSEDVMIPFIPRRDQVVQTFGSGSTVFWTIWPAVLLHTVFAAVVTSISFTTPFYLAVPPVLITVLGVVIGFVISYRAMSGYERYWLGRGSWTDLIKISRTMSRLVWIHVPLRYDKDASSSDLTHAHKLMREKRLALDLILAFSVAVKHHLRGETGIYYDDLYHLVKPLHNHPNFQKNPKSALTSKRLDTPNSIHSAAGSSTTIRTPRRMPTLTTDPHIPAINEYGTFRSISSCSSEDESERPHLKSTSNRANGSRVLTELVPFSSFFSTVGSWIGLRSKQIYEDDDDESHSEQKQMLVPKYGRKFRPAIAGGGKNLPLEILSLLSEWVSILDNRGTISGNPLGGLYGSLASFEDSLSTLEKILTTPLPFVYSAHIRQCVWLYLFLLPFQMVEQFEWFTIPGVCIAAFFYIGFLAAGEEIEQPFGYDQNDLDLDLFCHRIIREDIESLKRMHCINTYIPEHEVQVKGDSSCDRPSIENFASTL